MTNPTLSSSNPTLTATYTDEQVVFSGGSGGKHSLWLSVSSPERIKAHWDGYCENNDAKAVDSSEVIRVRKLTRGQVQWCHNALNTAGMDTEHDVTETATFGGSYVEGTREDLAQMVASLVSMTGLIEDDLCEAFHSYDYESVPEWMRERLVEQATKCCDTAATKITEALSK